MEVWLVQVQHLWSSSVSPFIKVFFDKIGHQDCFGILCCTSRMPQPPSADLLGKHSVCWQFFRDAFTCAPCACLSSWFLVAVYKTTIQQRSICSNLYKRDNTWLHSASFLFLFFSFKHVLLFGFFLLFFFLSHGIAWEKITQLIHWITHISSILLMYIMKNNNKTQK